MWVENSALRIHQQKEKKNLKATIFMHHMHHFKFNAFKSHYSVYLYMKHKPALRRLRLPRLWPALDCRNMEVSVAVYLVGGGLFCQAKNSPDLSWKQKDRNSGLFGSWFHTSGDFNIVAGNDDISFPD